MDNEISIVPFRYKYFSALISLLESNDYQQLSHVTMKTLPKIGYMALMNGHPIAAGFLRKVEGGYAQIDTLTSNRFFGAKARNDGINKVVNALIQDAKDLNLHGILAFTQEETIVNRSVERGFKLLPVQILGISFK